MLAELLTQDIHFQSSFLKVYICKRADKDKHVDETTM